LLSRGIGLALGTFLSLERGFIAVPS